MVPHLGHMELIVVEGTASVHIWAVVKETKNIIYEHALSLELTFAGFRTLKPFVINVPVASTSTILIPSTTRSATTESA